MKTITIYYKDKVTPIISGLQPDAVPSVAYVNDQTYAYSVTYTIPDTEDAVEFIAACDRSSLLDIAVGSSYTATDTSVFAHTVAYDSLVDGDECFMHAKPRLVSAELLANMVGDFKVVVGLKSSAPDFEMKVNLSDGSYYPIYWKGSRLTAGSSESLESITSVNTCTVEVSRTEDTLKIVASSGGRDLVRYYPSGTAHVVTSVTYSVRAVGESGYTELQKLYVKSNDLSFSSVGPQDIIYTLSKQDARSKTIILPFDVQTISITPEDEQVYSTDGVDFNVSGRAVSWEGMSLDAVNLMQDQSEIRLQYTLVPGQSPEVVKSGGMFRPAAGITKREHFDSMVIKGAQNGAP